MKISLNTTIRPVGFDYARALFETRSLRTLVSAFPRFAVRKSCEIGNLPVRYCGGVQTVFLVAQRLTGANAFTRWLSHLSKVRLDIATARLISDEDAVIFYSGAGLHTIRAARRRGILSVCQVHHTHVLKQEQILRKEAAACGFPYTPIYSRAQVRRQLQEFEQCDVILCPSNAVAESFEQAGFSRGRIAVVPHGVNLGASETLPSASLSGPALRVLYVGQLHYRKGLRHLAQAICRSGAEQIECRLVGPDFGLSGLNAVPDVGQFVKTGPRKGAELAREYSEADLFVLPSLEEGFGLVVLEAMRSGLPVLITSAVGAKDFVTNGVEGWIVPPGDAEALRTKIEWMRNHPQERAAMGRAAAHRARQTGGWDSSARQLMQALAEHVTRLHVEA